MSNNPLLNAAELNELIERTRVIGADTSLVVHGGGNTSSKGIVTLEDGREQRVMWIKASGGDMATATPHTFAPLDLDGIDALRVHDDLTDEEMVELVSKTSLLAGAPRPSIETLLHGFMPFKHIDHVHADAICALTNHPKGREATLEALGDEWAYVEWMRSGFPLSKVVETLGDYRGVVLAHHGVITWAETSEECLKETLAVVKKAQDYLDARSTKTSVTSVSSPDLHQLLPLVRGHLSGTRHRIVRVDRRLEEIASRPDVKTLVTAGVSSADHMLRVRPFSIVLDDPTEQGIADAFDNYARDYDEYVERQKGHLPEGYDLFDNIPKVALVPGLGALTVGDTLAEAKMLGDIALHTHTVAAQVMDAFGEVEAMPEPEIFRFEYWPMELYKLGLKPGPKKFSGKVFIVTGAAKGIGYGVARHLSSLGASLVLADIDADRLEAASLEIQQEFKNDCITVAGDQTDINVVTQTVGAAIEAYGGVDGFVANAGIAVTGEVADLGLEDWNRAIAINLTGPFLLAQATLRVMRPQNLGGSLVYMASKNAFAPGSGFGAYSVTKAGIVQLMRITAIEAGQFGIRSNALNPDAIFDNSDLWSGGIREERAAAHGIKPDELEEFYAKRNLLHRHVRSVDVAKSVEYLLSDDSSRTTGAVIPVDGGVVGGFPR